MARYYETYCLNEKKEINEKITTSILRDSQSQANKKLLLKYPKQPNETQVNFAYYIMQKEALYDLAEVKADTELNVELQELIRTAEQQMMINESGESENSDHE